MCFRVCVISIALLSVTTGKPLSSPQQDDTMGSSEIWPSDAGMFTEAAAGNLDSSALLALNPVSSDVSSGYSMFSDSDAGLSAFAMGSDGENTSNLVASCVGESNVDPSSGLDILMSRDSLDETWTSLAPATEENQCPSKQDPKPPPEPQLSIPSLLEYIDTDECPPLPDGRKRHALCCYDPDIVISPGNSVAKNCWRLEFLETHFWGCKKPGQEGYQRCCILYFVETSEGFTCTTGYENQIANFNPSL